MFVCLVLVWFWFCQGLVQLFPSSIRKSFPFPPSSNVKQGTRYFHDLHAALSTSELNLPHRIPWQKLFLSTQRQEVVYDQTAWFYHGRMMSLLSTLRSLVQRYEGEL